MKQLKFRKGITKIRIPFLLHDFSPWQDQVKEEIKKIRKYKYRKDAEIEFELTNYYAEISLNIK